MDFSPISPLYSSKDYPEGSDLYGRTEHLEDDLASIPCRSLDKIGRFVVLPAIKESHQNYLVPIAGLILALTLLSTTEMLSDKLAILNLSRQKAEGHLSLNLPKISLPFESDELSASLSVWAKGFDAGWLETKGAWKTFWVEEVLPLSPARKKIEISHRLPTGAGLALVERSLSSPWPQTVATISDLRTDIRSVVGQINYFSQRPVWAISDALLLADHNITLAVETGQIVTERFSRGVSELALVSTKVELASRHLLDKNVALVGSATLSVKQASLLATAQLAATDLFVRNTTSDFVWVADFADKALMAAAAESLSGADQAFQAIWYGVPRLVIAGYEKVVGIMAEFWFNVKSNWLNFFSGNSADTSNLAGDALREQIRQEVLDELELEFSGVFDRLREGQPTVIQEPIGGKSGVVVVPEGKTPESRAVIQGRLEQMFSDPVKVRFDQGGNSGVITPEFREQPGDNYIFLLTPIQDK